ncbi:uncharacterized protein BYT42DRAFT_543615 [Radiomyces spectabilis]|uniref:uncharacterized protein n=1 Tax=Radiomyces spectabilis TaxID=64574 RepID=UPI00221EF626|nr:uncharacterized protein BYT42DRAFT_543615 [Radiomyces spectabilis]KAI8388285.1 hypothetical protein BYT42DRAFT_543615 [Radiomyces spectabilis]
MSQLQRNETTEVKTAKAAKRRAEIARIASKHRSGNSHPAKAESHQALLYDKPVPVSNGSIGQGEPGFNLSHILKAMHDELDIVERLLSDTSEPMTDELIQSLQKRINVVAGTIEGMKDESKGLLEISTMTEETLALSTAQLVKVEERCHIVEQWVQQVRAYFSTNERARSEIQEHLAVLAQREIAQPVDPFIPDVVMPDKEIQTMSEEHDRLKQVIEAFDTKTRPSLESYVLSFANIEKERNLNPHDLATVQITLTTLGLLEKLTQQLQRRTLVMDLLMLRVRWESKFNRSVRWIAVTDREIDDFIASKARWSENNEDYHGSIVNTNREYRGAIEEVLNILVAIEKKVWDFDSGGYSEVLDRYHEIEQKSQSSLPNHLEVRQKGFEKAFEDLIKRSILSRKVVEQHLSMIDAVLQFRKLRDEGEALRQLMLEDPESYSWLKGEDEFAELIQLFKNNSAYLVTNITSKIPYPDPPSMSTAMGSDDAQAVQTTNESIRSTISGYSMTLALIADGLDQLLLSRKSVQMLQNRAMHAHDALNRVIGWMTGRLQLLEQCELPLFRLDMHDITEEDISRMEKERDNISDRLQQLEQEDLTKLLQDVRALELDVDALNAVSIDRSTLINQVETLEKTHSTLHERLAQRGLELEALRNRLSWESQWLKAHQWILLNARKLWDFNAKKARFSPSRDDTESPSYDGDHEIRQIAQTLQDRVNEIQAKYIEPLSIAYDSLTKSYQAFADNPEAKASCEQIQAKESLLLQKYSELQQLSGHTSELLTHRFMVIEFLLRVHDAQHEGEKIKDTILKMMRRIMEHNQQRCTERVKQFKDTITKIWDDCGKELVYPTFHSQVLQSSVVSIRDTNDGLALVQQQMAELMDRKMGTLRKLEQSMEELIEAYDEADKMKSLAHQYDVEVSKLRRWIDEQITVLKSQHVDVAEEAFQHISEQYVRELQQERSQLVSKVQDFENSELQLLHDQVAQFLESSMQKQPTLIVDTTTATRSLKDLLEQFQHLKTGLNYQAITLEAALKRLAWQEKLRRGTERLESMSQQLRDFTAKKNKWSLPEDLSTEHMLQLEKELNNLIAQKTDFILVMMPEIQKCYEDFIEYFPRLARPIATPDHIEANMEALERMSNRFQENISSKITELNLFKQCIRWIEAVGRTVEFLTKQESLLEAFVNHKARWCPKTVLQDNDEEELRIEWAKFKQAFDEQGAVAGQLKQQFEELRATANECNSNIVGDMLSKKWQDMAGAENKVDHYLIFSNEIVTQRCLIAAFIFRSTQLEQSAEVIHEEFLASQQDTDSHVDRLDRFKRGVDDVRDHLASSIPYPVRSLEYASAEHQLKDETANAIIKDTIEIRNTRLQDRLSSLQLILASKQHISRQRMMLRSYVTQLEACQTWITVRRSMVEDNKHIQATESMEVGELREALSVIISIQQAMSATDNVFTSLMSAYRKCELAFQEPVNNEFVSTDDEVSKENFDTLLPEQNRLEKAWYQLSDDVTYISEGMANLLLTKEMEHDVRMMLDRLQQLRGEMEAQQVSSVSDTIITMWQNQVDAIDTNEYQVIYQQWSSKKNTLKDELAQTTEKKLHEAEKLIGEIRSKMSLLLNGMTLHRLQTDYSHTMGALMDSMTEMTTRIRDSKQTYKAVPSSSKDDRTLQYQALSSLLKESKKTMNEGSDRYHDLCALYTSIQELAKNESTHLLHEKTKKAWKDFQDEATEFVMFVSRTSKWMDSYDQLDTVYTDISSCCDRLDHMEIDDLDAATSILAECKKSIKDNELLLEELDEQVDASDMDNIPQFHERRVVVAGQLDSLRALFAKNNDTLESAQKKQSVLKAIDRLHQKCQDQLRNSEHLPVAEKEALNGDTQTIFSAIQLYKDTLRTIQNGYHECKIEFETFINKEMEYITQKGAMSVEEASEIQRPLEVGLTMLSGALIVEEGCLKHLKSVHMLVQKADAVTDISVRFKRVASHVQDIEADYSEIDFGSADIDRHCEAIEELVADYNTFSHEFKQQLATNAFSKSRTAAVRNTVTKKDEEVHHQWSEIEGFAASVRASLKEHERHRDFVSKLNETKRYVDNLRQRVRSLHLTSKEAPMEDQDLQEILYEMDTTLKTKIEAIDQLHGVSIDKTGRFRDTKIQLIAAVEQVQEMLRSKQNQASEQENITELTTMMDRLEEEIAHVVVAIENAAPQHARIVNNKFNKADLQSILKTLVTTYKTHAAKIGETIKEIKNYVQAQELHDHPNITEPLNKLIAKWTKTQSSASMREKELQTCINQLDHEFFTKLAVAKSTVRDRQEANVQQGSSYLRLDHSTNDKKWPAVSHARVSQATFPKEPLHTTAYPRVPVLAESKSELDREVGRIVNDSPYRVKVKNVPGEVGKYWFGDENPRLVYCRILSSQLVMVRVGGGWVELSKFLRDHGLNEGIVSPRTNEEASTGSLNETPRFKEAYMSVVRSVSPSGRVVLRGGGASSDNGSNGSTGLTPTRSSSKSSGSRSRSPIPCGYVDGDKYIRIDEAGNQVVIKMTKAADDAKTPTISRKRTREKLNKAS